MGGIAAAQQPADGRSENEAETEGGADQAHAMGPLLRRRHIGDIGLGGGDVSGHGAGQRAGREQFPQGAREGEPDVGKRDAQDARHQHGLAALKVAQPAP